jgi:hypothetical protein
MTNLLILSITLLTNAPDRHFIGYSGDNATWYVNSNICHVVAVTYYAPTGSYAVMWDIDPTPNEPFPDGNGSRGANFTRCTDYVTNTLAGVYTNLVVVPKSEMGFFAMKKR